ncbi:hypothetical protein JCM10213_006909 [Rhodosporidiobolus nylandii]
MSTADRDAVLARAKAAGLPPNLILSARSSPAALRMVEALLAKRAPAPKPSPPPAPVEEQQPEELDALQVWMGQQVAAARRNHEEESARPLRKPAPLNREAAVRSLARQREQLMQPKEDGAVNVVASFAGLPKSFSDKSLEDLKPITFDEMYVSQAHRGRYLPCRIISVPTDNLSISIIAEDPTGRAEFIGIYHYPLHGVKTGPDLDALFPLGQILVIKEPTFKMNQSNTGALIRVDTPTDILFLPPSHPLLDGVSWSTPSPAEPLSPSLDHQERGNSLLGQQKYLPAVKAFTDGLATSPSPTPEQTLLLHLARADAHHHLGNFASAHRDASSVLSFLAEDVSAPPQTELKATLLRARALEGLRLHAQAKDAYARVLELDARSRAGQTGIERVESLLREAKTGEYDWDRLVVESNAWEEGKGAASEVGNFVGPVKVARMQERGGGRGVIATRDIEAGELLLVEKAASVGYEDPDSTTVVSLFDLRKNRSAAFAQLRLLDSLTAKMADDPSLCEQVYTLYGGDEDPATGEGALGGMSSRALDSTPASAAVDVARVENIVSQNGFSLTDVRDKRDKRYSPVALYVHTAFFNHSCIPNAMRSTYADVMVIRARAPISAGSEVFIAYVSPDGDLAEKREDVFKVHFGEGGCLCPLCNSDRRDGSAKVARRADLVRQINALNQAIRTLSSAAYEKQLASKRAEMVSLVTAIEATYTSPREAGAVKPELVKPYHFLAELYSPLGASTAAKGIAYELKAVEAAGAVVRTTKSGGVEVVAGPACARGLTTQLLLCVAYRKSVAKTQKEKSEAKAWVAAAQRMARILEGDDRRRFLVREGQLLDSLKLGGLVE